MISSPTLLLGLGNPILGDDGIGWKVIDAIRQQLSNERPENCMFCEASLRKTYNFPGSPTNLEMDCLSVGGLSLMERMLGYERVIVVDAVQTGAAPGTVHHWRLEDLPNPASGHTTSAHDASLQTALEMAKSLGEQVPREVTIIGIEAQQVLDFSETLSPPVAAAIPQAVAFVQSAINNPKSEFPEAL